MLVSLICRLRKPVRVSSLLDSSLPSAVPKGFGVSDARCSRRLHLASLTHQRASCGCAATCMGQKVQRRTTASDLHLPHRQCSTLSCCSFNPSCIVVAIPCGRHVGDF